MSNFNKTAMDNLIGGLTAPTSEAPTPTPPRVHPTPKEEPSKRVRPKKPEVEQVTMLLDKQLMMKVRALAYQESSTVKDIFRVSVSNFIDNYEARYGKLPVAKPRSGGIEALANQQE